MSISVKYFEARRQLIEDDETEGSGAWQISWFRIAKGWGMLPDEYWEKGGVLERPDTDPKKLDGIAKLRRLNLYQRLRSEAEVLYAVSNQRVTTTALEISRAWHDAPDGLIPLDDNGYPPVAVHSIGYAGFDFDSNCFLFPNSWGPRWGDQGFGFLPFGYLSRSLVEGWTAAFDEPFVQPHYPGTRLTIQKSKPSLLGQPWIINIQDGDKNEIVAWAHVVQKESCFDVEELFVRPEYRRCGHGRKLAETIQQSAPKSHALRFWVPWGDHCEANRPRLLNWAKSVGLRLHPSEVRWAAFLASSGDSVETPPDLKWTPSKATSPVGLLAARNETDVVELEPEWDDERATRRAELVDLKFRHGLSTSEEQELELLQEEFGRYQDSIAPLDLD